MDVVPTVRRSSRPGVDELAAFAGLSDQEATHHALATLPPLNRLEDSSRMGRRRASSGRQRRRESGLGKWIPMSFSIVEMEASEYADSILETLEVERLEEADEMDMAGDERGGLCQRGIDTGLKERRECASPLYSTSIYSPGFAEQLSFACRSHHRGREGVCADADALSSSPSSASITLGMGAWVLEPLACDTRLWPEP